LLIYLCIFVYLYIFVRHMNTGLKLKNDERYIQEIKK